MPLKLKVCAALFFLLRLSGQLNAADAGITAIRNISQLTARPAHVLNVFFTPGEKLSATDLEVRENWVVKVIYKNQSIPPLLTLTPLTVERIDTGSYDAIDRVDVHLTGIVAPGFDHVTVQYSGPEGASTKTVAAPVVTSEASAKTVTAAKGADDADINLNGSISPAVGSGPTYSTNSSIAFKIAPKKGRGEWWNIAANVKVENRESADPDSLRWRLSWQRIAAGRFAPSWDLGVAGMEFDRKGQATNLLTSPRFLIPAILRPWPTNGELKGNVELDVYGGVEAGRNLKDTFVFANGSIPGTHGFLRGVPGATLTIWSARPFGLAVKRISFTSDYQVRLLATREIFLETRLNTINPVPFLRQQPRHHWQNDLTFKISDTLGFTIQHEVGSLPPAYTYLQHKLTIGFTLLLKENPYLRLY